jgi:hypothetical protein
MAHRLPEFQVLPSCDLFSYLMSDSFNSIIIGEVTASLAMAARLSQYLTGAMIARLEAGPNADDHPCIIRQVNTLPRRLHGGLLYNTPKALSNRAVMNPAGRLLPKVPAQVAWMSGIECAPPMLTQIAGGESKG